MNVSSRFVVSVLSGIIFSAVAARPAAAQSAPVIVEAGYQYLYASASGGNLSFPGGFNIAVATKLSGAWSGVGEIGWSRHVYSGLGTNADATNYGAGLRWTAGGDAHANVFAQVLFGGETDSVTSQPSGTNVMVQPGIGISAPVGSIGVYAQVDYRRVFSTVAQNDVRAVAGVRVPIGK